MPNIKSDYYAKDTGKDFNYPSCHDFWAASSDDNELFWAAQRAHHWTSEGIRIQFEPESFNVVTTCNYTGCQRRAAFAKTQFEPRYLSADLVSVQTYCIQHGIVDRDGTPIGDESNANELLRIDLCEGAMA